MSSEHNDQKGSVPVKIKFTETVYPSYDEERFIKTTLALVAGGFSAGTSIQTVAEVFCQGKNLTAAMIAGNMMEGGMYGTAAGLVGVLTVMVGSIAFAKPKEE